MAAQKWDAEEFHPFVKHSCFQNIKFPTLLGGWAELFSILAIQIDDILCKTADRS